MKSSITHASELVNALEKIKILNTFTDCIRKNILRVGKLEFIASLFGLPYFCFFKQLGNQFLLSFCIATAILRKLFC